MENYFFMTVLQILNSLFYLFIYPFVIRQVGADSYGLYIFAVAVASYFSTVIQFGFDTPALKVISQNSTDTNIHSQIISSVLCAKLWLFLLSVMVFVFLLFVIPLFHANIILFIVCFFTVFSNMLFPTWYFQGIQQMRVVTVIQLSLKLISLPIIFILIQQPSDIPIYAAITTTTGVFGGITAMIILKHRYRIKIKWMPLSQLKMWYKDSVPFFLTNSMLTAKAQTANIMIGAFFTMADVALYDLAVKIYTVPTTFIASINGALFPKMINNVRKAILKKVLIAENLLGMLVIIGLAVFGKPIIVLLGGWEMINAYPLLIILSFSIFCQLAVSATINFIFVAKKKYFLIAKNQLIACMIFFAGAATGIIGNIGVVAIPLALCLSAMGEILYCYYHAKKIKLQ